MSVCCSHIVYYVTVCISIPCCSVLQCVAVRCSALQCVAVRCSALQCIVAVRYSALQCVAVRCSDLHCVAVHGSRMSTMIERELREYNSWSRRVLSTFYFLVSYGRKPCLCRALLYKITDNLESTLQNILQKSPGKLESPQQHIAT